MAYEMADTMETVHETSDRVQRSRFSIKEGEKNTLVIKKHRDPSVSKVYKRVLGCLVEFPEVRVHVDPSTFEEPEIKDDSDFKPLESMVHLLPRR